MFTLAVIKENVKLSPNKMRNNFVQAIVLALNQKYCNKIIIDLGLCVSVLDVLEAEDPYVHSGEASAHVKVKFRLIMFRPFVGEVLTGKVRSNSEEGIHVSLGFFEDIIIPPSCMQGETTFDPNEQVWAWNYDGTKMYIDNGEVIRFRVLSEHFTETAPVQKDVLMANRAAALAAAASSNSNTLQVEPVAVENSLPLIPPFKLIASIAEDGLGLTRWWQQNDQQEQDLEE